MRSVAVFDDATIRGFAAFVSRAPPSRRGAERPGNLMRLAILLAFAAAAAAGTAVAQSSTAPLAFPRLSPQSPYAASLPPGPVGNWRNHVTVDTQGRENGVGARAEGRILVDGVWRPVRLTVDCAEGETGVYLHVEPATRQSSVDVATSIDGRRERTSAWTVCRTNDCIGLWNRAGVSLAAQLMEARELRLEIDRPGRRDSPVVVDLAGAQTALAPVARQCGWPVRLEAAAPR